MALRLQKWYDRLSRVSSRCHALVSYSTSLHKMETTTHTLPLRHLQTTRVARLEMAARILFKEMD